MALGTDPRDVYNYRPLCVPCHKRLDHGGDKSHNAKLTWEQVEEIRALRYVGLSIPRLAKMYGAGESTICRIVRMETWIPEPVCAAAIRSNTQAELAAA